MKISLALDLKHRSDGAIEFLRWIADANPQETQLRAVHALPDGYGQLFRTLFSSEQGDLEQMVERRLKAVIEQHQAEELITDCQLLPAGDVAQALEQDCRKHACELLVIGRAAQLGEQALIRLGSVARKLVRHLQQVTAVVPPDLSCPQVGGGPVLVALACAEHDLAAARWAEGFARRMQRPLAFAHVSPPPENWAYDCLEGGQVQGVASYFLELGQRTARAWLDKHGFTGCELVVDQGEVAASLEAEAKAREACALVCGARRLSPAKALFSTSVGSELAALATTPVVLVPGEDGPSQ